MLSSNPHLWPRILPRRRIGVAPSRNTRATRICWLYSRKPGNCGRQIERRVAKAGRAARDHDSPRLSPHRYTGLENCGHCLGDRCDAPVGELARLPTSTWVESRRLASRLSSAGDSPPRARAEARRVLNAPQCPSHGMQGPSENPWIPLTASPASQAMARFPAAAARRPSPPPGAPATRYLRGSFARNPRNGRGRGAPA